MTNNKNFIIYLAGFFDGEGSIGLVNRKYKDKPISTQLRVNIGQKDPRVLYMVKDKYGGYLYKRKTNGKDIYQLDIYSEYATKLLEDMQPYLINKKRQCEIALKFRSVQLTNYRQKRSQEQLNIVQKMKAEISKLNKGLPKVAVV